MIEIYISFCQKHTFICIAVFITFIPLIVSLFKKTYREASFSSLLIYLITKLVIDLTMFHFASIKQSTVVYYNISIPVYYALIGSMFYHKFETTRYKKWLIWSIGLFTLFSIWDMVYINPEFSNLHEQQLVFYSGTVLSLLMIFWILLYLYEIMLLLKIPNLLNFPFFWVCSGFLLYFSSLVCIAPVLHYAEKWNNPLDIGFVYYVPYIFEIVCAIFISVGLWNFSFESYAKQ
ncbi:hypothetical protein FHS68_002701 [Dyadobacter arcticus]|uniref:Lycopene cyclase domain-containing protein n=1 Tax=Dyadobacter arcticus TaxID=1078754 RepID=A0ABX0UKP6_9BACT|nr:hypothetical protein [Dyadobacter arcticus]